MGDIHARYDQGNLVYWDKHRKGIIGGVGADLFGFTEDFVGPTGSHSADNLLGWTTTLVEAGAGETTLALVDGSGGWLLVSTDAADNDGANIQRLGEAFSFTSAQKFTYFGIRLKASEATQSDLLVGMCITDTDLLGGMTDGVYFRKVDGSAAVEFVTEKNSTETATAAVHTLVADTFVTYEFYFDGTAVEAFVNGVSVGRNTTNICDDELLTPSMHFLAGQAGGMTFTVDWVRAWQLGR